MTRVLLTAFEPYDRWPDNSSWTTLADLTRWYDGPVQLTTRRYPVHLAKMRERLQNDLKADYDFAILCGQAPGTAFVRLESVGLNVQCDGSPVIPGGPPAYHTTLPLPRMASQIRAAGIPAKVSHHAGTYLCNAALYVAGHVSDSFGLPTRSMFVHLPLTPAQVAREDGDGASMSVPMMSAALGILINELATPTMMA